MDSEQQELGSTSEIPTEPMSNEEAPRRDSDEMSIASDFSIIPESFAGQEEGTSGEQRSMPSGMDSFRSNHFHTSSSSSSGETSFGKVLFQNVQATYTADSDIAVSYVLTASVTAKSSDRVALYKVGFGSPQDYLTYKWAPTPSKDHTNNQLPLTVVFKASSLPKDAGEFFQFCYVTHEGRIVGVSTPFQLHAVGDSSVCGVDDGEDGMVVVCTKESVLHDKVNKLSEENEKISQDLSDSRAAFELKQVELADKTQQLNMCQHHLQALEAKMKKETSEKCELMGRVGQVVEEKGHLEEKLKYTIHNLEQSNLEKENNIIEAERLNKENELLLHNNRKLQVELEEKTNECQAAEQNCVKMREEILVLHKMKDEAVSELEMWTNSNAVDVHEKNSLELKFSTVNEELMLKSNELEKSKRLASELEEKLATAVVEMTSIKDNLTDVQEKLTKAEEEKTIHLERMKVVNQDNDQLKVTIQQLKNKVESLETSEGNEESGRAAAERIASDLSGRLQTAKAEYQSLALTNLRLVKKIKKLRQSVSPDVDNKKLSTMSVSVSSQGSSWMNVDETADNDKDLEDVASSSEVASSMIQSCTSALTSNTCSNCSHSTQMLSEAVNRKMEDIVQELSLQIQSLKMELKAREREQMTQERKSSRASSQEVTDSIREEPQEEAEMEQETLQQHQTEAPAEREVSQTQSREGSVESSRDVSAENTSEQQVLYSNSFLPAQRTAPVFLPERERQSSVASSANAQETGNDAVRPSAPSPTPSMISQRGGQSGTATPPVMIVSSSSGSNLVVPQPHLTVTRTQPGSILPPPLLPESTPTARQAAVMSQFSSQQVPSGLGHESDDDDFHSTSDNDDAPNINGDVRTFHYSSNSLFECPMCGLSFQPGAIRLLEEHINSHLEHVCPICSMAFQRNNHKTFEEHVHGHFSDEIDRDDNPLDDSSGPWGPQFRASRLLEID